MPPNYPPPKTNPLSAPRQLSLSPSLLSPERNLGPPKLQKNAVPRQAQPQLKNQAEVANRSTNLEDRQQLQPHPSNIGANLSSVGYNGYGSGYMGGMGAMGLGYSAYGMGMGMPMGMGFNPLMMGPMAFLANMNYLVMSVGQVINMLGMSSSVFVGMFESLVHTFRQLETYVRRSPVRQWFQRKSKKSGAFRFIIVIACMAIVGTASKLVKDVIKGYLGRWGDGRSLLTAGIASSSATV